MLDEYGGTAGLITLEDLLEEIVGEIKNPFDDVVPEIQRINQDTLMVDGLTLIEDVNEFTGTKFHDDNYDTIAGFFLGHLDHIPTIGEEIILSKRNPTSGNRDGWAEDCQNPDYGSVILMVPGPGTKPLYARLAVNVPHVQGIFDYHLPQAIQADFKLGQLVEVPFGRQSVQGIIIDFPERACGHKNQGHSENPRPHARSNFRADRIGSLYLQGNSFPVGGHTAGHGTGRTERPGGHPLPLNR